MKVEIELETLNELISCIQEAIDLTEDTVTGSYTPDSFTTQPWRAILEKYQFEIIRDWQ